MPTFRLKPAFCLILVVGVALMWWKRASGTDEESVTADQLLDAREKAKSILQTRDQYNAVKSIGVIEASWFHSSERVSLDTKWGAKVHFDMKRSGGLYSSVIWHTHWPTIEARAAEENWIFYRQVIITVLAAIVLGWAVCGCEIRRWLDYDNELSKADANAQDATKRESSTTS